MNTPWYKNSTIIGIGVTAIVGVVGSFFKTDIQAYAGDLTNGLLGLGILIGAVVGVVKQIKTKPKE